MTLTIQDLGALGELLGSIAVLVTLIYLAMQTRQNTMATFAQLEGARIQAVQNFNLGALASEQLQAAVVEDNTTDETLAQWQLRTYWRSSFHLIQWQFQQSRRGLLPSFNETGFATRIPLMFEDSRGMEGFRKAARTSFAPDFVEWIEEQGAKAA